VPAENEVGHSAKNKEPTDKYGYGDSGRSWHNDGETTCKDHQDTQNNGPSQHFLYRCDGRNRCGTHDDSSAILSELHESNSAGGCGQLGAIY
jgi:hypothetical protein